MKLGPQRGHTFTTGGILQKPRRFGVTRLPHREVGKNPRCDGPPLAIPPASQGSLLLPRLQRLEAQP
jgi:hypothetical protein